MKLDNATDTFLEFLDVDAEGKPFINAHESWSIVRSQGGDYLVTAVDENTEFDVLFSAPEVPSLWVESDPFPLNDSCQYNWLKNQIMFECEQG